MGFFNRFKNKFERSVEQTRAGVSSTETSDDASKEKKTTSANAAGNGGEYAYRVLSYAYVTEKSATLAHDRTYVFVVPLAATKLTVKMAVAEAYGVMPKSVRIIRRAGKRVRFGRTNGQRKDWKKAYVTLPEGKTLPIYE